MKGNEMSINQKLKRKGIMSLAAVGAAAVWLILWSLFPMEWYSLFFASTVGSYVQIVLLCTVLILPFCWIMSIITSADVSSLLNYIVNLVFMMLILFLFSAFRYSMPWLVAIAAVLHIGAMVWVYGSAEKYKTGRISLKHKEEPVPEGIKMIKKQPLITIMWAAIYTIAINALNIFLFWKMAYIYYS